MIDLQDAAEESRDERQCLREERHCFRRQRTPARLFLAVVTWRMLKKSAAMKTPLKAQISVRMTAVKGQWKVSGSSVQGGGRHDDCDERRRKVSGRAVEGVVKGQRKGHGRGSEGAVEGQGQGQ